MIEPVIQEENGPRIIVAGVGGAGTNAVDNMILLTTPVVPVMEAGSRDPAYISADRALRADPVAVMLPVTSSQSVPFSGY